MEFDFLIKDIKTISTKKALGTDKGLAKIGDGIVNLVYSVAKSIYLTQNLNTNNIIRTGKKVSKKILADALKNADMKSFAKTRADAHDLADTAEAIFAYIWLSNKMTIPNLIEKLVDNFPGNLIERNEEIENATIAFTKLLNEIKIQLPEKLK